jgi:PKD repeat protein
MGGEEVRNMAGRTVRKGGARSRARVIVAAALALLLSATALVVAPTAGAVTDSRQPGQVVSATSPVSWSPWVMDGYVRTFADMGSYIISGGNFTTVRKANTSTNVTRNNIMAFDKVTGNIRPFNPSINGEVFKILPAGDGNVFVAGGFSQVNGQTVRSIVKINAETGQRVTQFNPPSFDGRIHDIFLRNGRLYVTGRFLNVANQPHTLLAALNPTTGALDPTVKATFSEPRRDGALNIYAADITPDGSTLIATGNFTRVNGLTRYQIAMLDLTQSPTGVVNWHTNQYGDGCSRSFQSYMRDVEFSPDGDYFVVVTTGAYSRSFLCDVAARWNTDRRGSNLNPEWTNYTGGDTLTAVAITDDVVYVGGHQNYMNNPYAGDAVGNGAVPRDGLAALDPRDGATLSWNPSRERGWGVYGFQLTDDGLWIGSDTERLAGGKYHPRQAMLPLQGGSTLPPENVGQLPSNVYSLGLMQGGSGTQLDRVAVHPMSVNGTTGAQTISAGTSQWRNLRGAFMVDGKLYTGWSDQTFKVQNFNGSTFGPQTNISLRLDPSSASLNRFASQDLSTITGMFYDRDRGRIYFTKSGSNNLFWRSFSPESNIVGAERYQSSSGAGGVTWSGVQSMFLANGRLYTVNTSGVLSSRTWDSAAGLPTGPATNISGPNIDGHDWRARDAFVLAGPVNTPPVARITSSCNGLTCSFSGTGSSDSNGTITSYAWNFGDGATGTGATANHTYAAAGTYEVTLTVTDNGGATGTTTTSVTVVDPNTTGQVNFRAANGSDANSTTPRVQIPASVQAGDRLLLVATQNVTTGTVTGPAGWTLLDSSTGPSGTLRSYVWTKTATAADAGSQVGPNSSEIAKTSLVVAAYSGTSGVSAHAVGVETSSTTQHTTPTVNVASAGSTLVSYWSDKTSDGTGWTLPLGVNGRAQTVGTGNGRITATLGDSAGQAPGTRGGLTATSAASPTSRAIAWSIVLAPGGSQPPPVNQPPTAAMTWNCTGLTCTFSGAGSSDPEGPIASYSWNFGDGGTGTGVGPSHTYAASGSYPVSLTVTDSGGLTATATGTVTVTSGPPPASQIAFKGANGAETNWIAAAVNIPGNVAPGDRLVLIATGNRADTTFTGPAGWTLVDSVTSSGNGMISSVWTKAATAGDAGTQIAVTTTETTKITLQVAAYSGTSGIAARANQVDSVASTTHSTPPIQVATAGSTVINYWADKSNDNTGWTLPAGVTGRVQTVGPGNGRITAVIADTQGVAAMPEVPE